MLQPRRNEDQQDFVSLEMRTGKFENSSASNNADSKLDKAGSTLGRA